MKKAPLPGPFFVNAMHNIVMHDADARRIAWSQYWGAGSLHSCPGSFAGNYSGCIADFWQRTLPQIGPGAKVLDLATGNGALPQMLLQRYGDEVSVDAVDSAQLAPIWFDQLRYGQVRFHPGVAIEELPFADASFDYVISQYGVEYAVRPDSWEQALRVLKPDGQIICVMHHSDSVLARVAAEEQKHFAWLLGSEGLLAATEGLLQWLPLSKFGEKLRANPSAEHSRHAFNAAQQALAVRVETSTVPDLLLEARYQVHELLRQPQPRYPLSRYVDALKAARLRSAELLQFAFSPEQLDDFIKWLRMRRPDSHIQVQVLQQTQGIMGWGLHVRL